MVALFDKAIAILWRDFLTGIRYRGAFVMGAAGALIEIAGLYYLSRAIGPSFRPDGMESYPFLLVGTGLYTFLLMGISSFVSAVQEAQQAGTFEVLVSTSTSPALVIFLSAVSAFMGGGFTFLLYVVGGLWVAPVHLQSTTVVGCIVVMGFSLCIAAAIGIAAAAIQLTVQKGSAVVWLLGSIAWLLTGTMFPVSSLPGWLHGLASWIPITHALQGMRIALLNGSAHAALGKEIAVLAGFSMLLLPISLLLFQQALRRARVNGTLSFY